MGSLRESYQSDGLEAADVAADPMSQFEAWFNEVLEAKYWEPNAMVVSSIDDDGFPASRNVLLKAFDESGFIFYTNYTSDKGRQLLARPQTSLTFSWIELRRQVRIVGLAERLTDDESDAYFASRPRGSQLGAWASPQSTVIPDRQALDDQEAAMIERFDGGPVPRPPHWGGFLVRPHAVEFWQGRPNRLHDRLRYRHADDTGEWQIERLAP